MPQVTIGGAAPDGARFANQTRIVNRFPDECPICHRNINPEVAAPGFEYRQRLELFFRCASAQCLRSFMCMYKRDTEHNTNPPSFIFDYAIPNHPTEKVTEDEIKALSPAFVRIWTQAHKAESEGLDEIAGPGYRKALEFLAKDYAISLVTEEDEKTKIKKIPLQSVIKEYLGEDKLHVVSSRAAWLGNDETHYERRWVGKDLRDLKRLIAATEHFIAMEKLAAALPKEMPDPKSAPVS